VKKNMLARQLLTKQLKAGSLSGARKRVAYIAIATSKTAGNERKSR
jgi:hypothetical protein